MTDCDDGSLTCFSLLRLIFLVSDEDVPPLDSPRERSFLHES